MNEDLQSKNEKVKEEEAEKEVIWNFPEDGFHLYYMERRIEMNPILSTEMVVDEVKREKIKTLEDFDNLCMKVHSYESADQADKKVIREKGWKHELRGNSLIQQVVTNMAMFCGFLKKVE